MFMCKIEISINNAIGGWWEVYFGCFIHDIYAKRKFMRIVKKIYIFEIYIFGKQNLVR